MADTKISGLTLGDPAQAADQIPINRAGVNFKITAASIRNLTGFSFNGGTDLNNVFDANLANEAGNFDGGAP